ncbi:recombination mediator RecR [uncultured Holdemanella sp.]|jgi:recombination protein RecR|uniref:recombination mediator RecR n=1 Tax=uncultured Holdemanella sp. TaxID=1763549 RepID=UPI0025FA26DC|nr:recombination mediator RecR [uncultured Holdemanella sp.]
MYPKTFDDLIYEFQKLPGVGVKTAERYAFTVLGWSEEEISEFSDILRVLKKNVKKCTRCGNLTEGEICDFCNDSSRNQNIICVVQNPKDISTIESMQEYNGVYHVLDGLINTQKGILPDQLNIMSLVDRINNDTEEVILALDPTVEGETTSLYISKLLEGKCRVTRLAHGIPVGSHLDYTDAMTLLKAFEGRKSS